MVLVFGSRRQKLLDSGVEAWATVSAVRESDVTYEFSLNVILSLHVNPAGMPGFDVETTVHVTRTTIPQPGERYLVRFDPADRTRVAIDDKPSLDKVASTWTLGTAGVIDVAKVAVDEDVLACTVNADIFLTDGTAPYRTTIQTNLSAAKAAKIHAESTILAVRADPDDRSHVAISWRDETPFVTITDPGWIEPPARAERDGQACRVVVSWWSRRWLKTANGEELFYAQLRVVGDPAEHDVVLLVPDEVAKQLLATDTPLPAKCVVGDPSAIAIDWSALRAEAAHGGPADPPAQRAARPQIAAATPPGMPAAGPRVISFSSGSASPAHTAQLQQFKQKLMQTVVQGLGSSKPSAAGPSADQPDRLELLTRLADLHERGVLTDAEFAAEKAKILGIS